MNKTSIGWTDYSWNPLLGCRRASPGCANCYAERLIAVRFSKNPKLPMYHGIARVTERGEPQFTGERKLLVDRLDEPLRRKKSAKVFVCDMGDIFFEGHPFEDIAAVFGVMAAAQHHTFQVLTKRAKRMAEFFAWVSRTNHPACWVAQSAGDHISTNFPGESRWDAALQRVVHQGTWPLPNVWLGVSVEDQARADERIQHLLKVPAAVRFLSVEPLLEDIEIKAAFGQYIDMHGNWRSGVGVSWVIVGGESGPKARPFAIEWARSIVKQCSDAQVPCFVKQMGARPYIVPGQYEWGSWSDELRGKLRREWIDDSGHRVTSTFATGQIERIVFVDSHGADPAEWPEDLRIQQFPAVAA